MINENTIIERSSILYYKYGIKSVSVDDVAILLGISKKTLYEFIENKSVLIEKVVENNLEDFFAIILENLESDEITDEDFFRNLCQIYLTILKETCKVNPSYVYDLKKYYNHHYQKIIEFRDNVLFKVISKCINKGIKTGLFRNDVNIKYVFFNQMSKISMMLFDSEFEYVNSISLNNIYILILNDIRGITTLKGHEIFDRNYESLRQLK
ncbi:MAG: TetR/AcrR family transcriptional regulator [Prolixibacteraceae bacterium]|nr:TetR/AcrR family transcriptional regulator [Prolixibacteraceae bacterium]